MQIQKKNFFNDVIEQSYDFSGDQGASTPSLNPSFGGGGDQTLQIGAGNSSINGDLNGFWIGAAAYRNAPFRVNMEGAVLARLFQEDGKSILDGTGLNSENNFTFGNKELTSQQIVVTTGWQEILGLSFSITLTKPTVILFHANISGYHDTVNNRIDLRLTRNSQQVGGVFTITELTNITVAEPQTVSGLAVCLAQPGTVDLKVEARGNDGVSNGYISGDIIPCTSTYLLLGS